MELTLPKIIVIVLILMIFVVTVAGALAFVGPGNRGVLLTWGKVEDRILQEGGPYFITPYAQSVIPIEVRTQKYESSASSASKDLQIVSTEVTLNYRIDAGRVNEIFQKLGYDWESRIISPAIQEAVKASTAKFTAEELITKRALVKQEIEFALSDRLANFGILTETVSITEFDFSPEFNAAIEQKVTAEQLALKAQRDLERITIEAQQEIEKAKARAKSIQIEAEALKENPQLVSLRWVEKWNGVPPQFLVTGEGGSSNFLLDISALQGG